MQKISKQQATIGKTYFYLFIRKKLFVTSSLDGVPRKNIVKFCEEFGDENTFSLFSLIFLFFALSVLELLVNFSPDVLSLKFLWFKEPFNLLSRQEMNN